LFLATVLPVAIVSLSVAQAGASVRASSSKGGTPSAKTLIANAKRAILAQNSVHFVITVNDETTKQTESVVGDVGKKTGTESFSAGKDTASLRVNSVGAYIEGNSAGLEEFFGMPKADAGKVGSKWITVKAGSSQYSSLQSSVALSTLSTSLFPATKSVKVIKAKQSGVEIYELEWTVKASGTTTDRLLEIASSGAPLPISAVGTSLATSGGVLQTISLGKWNESLNIPSPSASDTIAFSSLTS
jgi:hypothetical protein